MHLHRVGPWALLALALSFAAHEAEAGRRNSPTESLAGRPVRRVHLPGVDTSIPVCRVGEHGAPASSENVIYFNENDTYYTWLNVTTDSCAACTTDTYANVTAAHLALFFPFAPETVQVQVGLVGVIPSPCRFQDPSIVVCSPFVVMFDSQESVVTTDFAFPFPSECKILMPPNGQGQAFLFYNFLTASDTSNAHKPRLATQQQGKLCVSYNPVGLEILDFVTAYASGNPIMYVDVEQCISTPVLRTTWGRLKQRYR